MLRQHCNPMRCRCGFKARLKRIRRAPKGLSAVPGGGLRGSTSVFRHLRQKIAKGGCGRFFGLGLNPEPQPPPAAVDGIVHRLAALAEGLEPVRAVEAHPSVEHRGEHLLGHAAPVAPVEHLVLQVAEEALACGVVRRAALARHRPGDPVLLAYANPAVPAVVAPAVGMA